MSRRAARLRHQLPLIVWLFLAGCAPAGPTVTVLPPFEPQWRPVQQAPVSGPESQAPAALKNPERDRYECLREAMMVPQIALPDSPPPLTGGGGFAEAYARGRALADHRARIEQSYDQERPGPRRRLMAKTLTPWRRPGRR